MSVEFVPFYGIPEEDGRFILLISAEQYPTFTANAIEWSPKASGSIRRIENADFEFICDEVIDLDEWEQIRESEPEDES